MQQKTVSNSFDVTPVYDGENGKDAVSYDIVFTEAWAKATPEGVISARLRGHAYKIEGSNRTPLNGATIRYGYNPDNNDTYTYTMTGSQGEFDEDEWFDGDELDDYAKGSAVVFVSIIIDGKAVCTKFVTIVQEAADGKPGHVGRWYYYAGDWAPGAYTMQETQAPFVKRHTTIDGVEGDYFFMLDYGTSNVKIGTTELDPASNYNPVSGRGSKPWTLMQSTMQYYIAQAFFGPYAHFGSFIINGDWMISQYGTLIDVSGTKTIVDAANVNRQYNGKVPYAWFDATDPTASSNPQSGSYKFIPNFAVDGLTGKTYQNDAYVRGEITATSGTIGGFTIGTNRLYNSNWTAGVDIALDSKVVRIGKNAQGVMATENAIIRAENTEYGQTYNTALYLNAQNATYNYAFYGKGNGVLDGLVCGYKTQLITLGSGDARVNLDIKKGAAILITTSNYSGNKMVKLPILSEIKKVLGINESSAGTFRIELLFVNISGHSNIYIGFSESTSETNSGYPKRMSDVNTQYMGEAANWQIHSNQVVRVVLIAKDNDFRGYPLSS